MDENEQQLEYYIHPLPLNVFILENLEKETEQIKIQQLATQIVMEQSSGATATNTYKVFFFFD
jgi:uncharacterized membrane-anchored protein